jgi:O-6-methylguanine DNA methyltransferase
VNRLVVLGATKANNSTASACGNTSGISSGIATPRRLYIASNYQRVAREIARPKSGRPVGQALGRNPIPIVIPCHRVIASNGALGGYCGTNGIDLKRWLLRHEGAQL